MISKNAQEEQNFAEWNRTVSGFMRVWDIAELFGLTPCLAKHLEELPNSEMAACLAQKGNSRETCLRLLLLVLRALPEMEPEGGNGSLPGRNGEDQLLSMLDGAVVGAASPYLHLLPGYAELEGLPRTAVVCDSGPRRVARPRQAGRPRLGRKAGSPRRNTLRCRTSA